MMSEREIALELALHKACLRLADNAYLHIDLPGFDNAGAREDIATKLADFYLTPQMIKQETK